MLPEIWFLLWGVLWAVFFMLDGFDLGLAGLLPWLARDEKDRRTIHNAIGPYWDGNEVWLIAAGGVTFAAFPLVYAVMFSSLYSALMLVLFCLILRGAAVALRAESEGPAAHKIWDFIFTASSLAAAVLFGAAFANLFRGIPVDAEGGLRGNLFTLLSPYALLGGVLFLAAFLHHGALWLALKAEGELGDRAASAAAKLGIALAAVTLAFLAASYSATQLFQNYFTQPALFVIPGLVAAALIASLVLNRKRKTRLAFLASCLFIVYLVFFGLFGMYPFMIISTLSPAFSITIREAASGALTLKIMLGVTLVFLPLILAYQGWVYVLFKGKVGADLYGHGTPAKEKSASPP